MELHTNTENFGANSSKKQETLAEATDARCDTRGGEQKLRRQTLMYSLGSQILQGGCEGAKSLSELLLERLFERGLLARR